MSKMDPQTLTNHLSQFHGSDTLYRHAIFKIFQYTEGVQFLAQNAGAYWLIDLIMSHQLNSKVMKEEFQVWHLRVDNGSAMAICEDGNGNEVAWQEIPFTDFPLHEITLWLEHRTLMLPSER